MGRIDHHYDVVAHRGLEEVGMNSHAGLPTGVIPISLILLALSAISQNFMIGLVAVAVFMLAIKMLWRANELQALLFIVVYQWFQAFAPVIRSAIKGAPIADLMGGPQFEYA